MALYAQINFGCDMAVDTSLTTNQIDSMEHNNVYVNSVLPSLYKKMVVHIQVNCNGPW